MKDVCICRRNSGKI